MKKLLLLASMAVALTAGAQNFKLTSNGTELTDGQTVNITKDHEIDWGDLIFVPKLKLTTSKAGQVTVTLKFSESTASPELSGLDEFDYLDGVGNAKLQICSPSIAVTCQTLTPGTEQSYKGNLSANYTENLMIKQVYTVGSSVNNIDGLTIKSEFVLTVAQGGETVTVKFVIDTDDAAIDSVAADKAAGSEVYYDLHGRKLAHPAKGINIVNGRKVLVK